MFLFCSKRRYQGHLRAINECCWDLWYMTPSSYDLCKKTPLKVKAFQSSSLKFCLAHMVSKIFRHWLLPVSSMVEHYVCWDVYQMPHTQNGLTFRMDTALICSIMCFQHNVWAKCVSSLKSLNSQPVGVARVLLFKQHLFLLSTCYFITLNVFFHEKCLPLIFHKEKINWLRLAPCS